MAMSDRVISLAQLFYKLSCSVEKIEKIEKIEQNSDSRCLFQMRKSSLHLPFIKLFLISFTANFSPLT